MKAYIETTLNRALDTLGVPPDAREGVVVEHSRGTGHGDFATNAALVLARSEKRNPRELAAQIVRALPASDDIEKAGVAGPGFVNFFLSPGAWQSELGRILDAGDEYGRQKSDANLRILVEFVSANPTGPLHVGHGRGAAYGDSLARILEAAGCGVHTEYYVNDAGRQADILAVSVWVALLELAGERPRLPEAAYPGEYIKQTAGKLREAFGETVVHPWKDIAAALPSDAPEGDKEAHVNALIEEAKTRLGKDYESLRRDALAMQVEGIQATLKRFNVHFDRWFSESSLVADGAIEHALTRLSDRGHTYEEEGALWLETSALGDAKDRVLRRGDGTTTYFASDVAYHLDKLERGHDIALDVWGADHHGYVARVRAAVEALTGRGEAFEAQLIQFVTLTSGRMGKRSGNFVTLDSLLDEAGTDATRFFYLARSHDQHLEFDVKLAQQRSNDNPVYYLQYAHARIASLWRQLKEKGLDWNRSSARRQLSRLGTNHELTLIKHIARFPETISAAAADRAPHQLAHYLGEVAQAFHANYNSETILVEDDAVRSARLALASATQGVIASGLALLGISAPERM
ncbi:MAG: arginine--tRNA ligase [Gammaproteobacteria bacterium]|nr:arginine--tRNA ligase [Gammaproteobacteria bacterium]